MVLILILILIPQAAIDAAKNEGKMLQAELMAFRDDPMYLDDADEEIDIESLLVSFSWVFVFIALVSCLVWFFLV